MTRSAARITRPPEPDPFRYGWRFVKKVLADGATDLVQVPLTLEDVLHPREGDVIPQSERQHTDAIYLEPIFHDRARRLPDGYVLGDRLIDWDVPGIRNHAPDLTVFEGVANRPQQNFGTFRLRVSGGRCVLGLEIVSPDTRDNDVVAKLQEYHQVGVPLYVLIDQETERGPRRLVGWRYTARRYVRMRPDRQGRLHLKPLGIWLALENDRAVCYDAGTGERLGGYETERDTRLAAEQEVRKQASARTAAERQARKQASARTAAEREAREQASAREAAEQRLRELEAELRRLRE